MIKYIMFDEIKLSWIRLLCRPPDVGPPTNHQGHNPGWSQKSVCHISVCARLTLWGSDLCFAICSRSASVDPNVRKRENHCIRSALEPVALKLLFLSNGIYDGIWHGRRRRPASRSAGRPVAAHGPPSDSLPSSYTTTSEKLDHKGLKLSSVTYTHTYVHTCVHTYTQACIISHYLTL